MALSVRSLLADGRFRLELAPGPWNAGDDAADALLDAPLTWAHSSDLADPTPWLDEGQLLLTDGAQFAPDGTVSDRSLPTRRPTASAPPATSPAAPPATAASVATSTSPADASGATATSPAHASAAGGGGAGGPVRAYVDRLKARGIRALGFATGVVHDEVPAALVEACAATSLPLLVMDETTPFIGIVRSVADAIATEQRERLEWSLDAQRAVARAALRVDGLGAILLELSRRLDCWVALFDSVGNVLRVPGLRGVPADLDRVVADAVASALGKGSRAGLSIIEAGGGISLQTLGQRGHLRGVLAVGATEPLDSAGHDLLASVIGLASIALEQRRTLDAARRRLRTGLFELVLSGVVDVADRTAGGLWGPLPTEPVRLAVVVGEVHGQSLLDELELQADENSGRLFFAERGDEIVLVTEHDDLAASQALLARHGLAAGVSGPVSWHELTRALGEARHAAGSVTRDAPVVLFEHLAEQGMHGLLVASGGDRVARRMLQPVLDLPAAERDTVLTTLRVWLTHNGAWDPAARELGTHRHTLRNRIRAAETLLGLDLDTFAGRAELWSALQLVA
ncbi:PucR family transcriptional regulator ligand-binding domain-containing protein [Herbiconiux sp. P15]|uniref:helix-turn-helix domain-containing protein n=1 Tax=Herbiconiux liukaitaii TaxID=3342799 RepID=UPI0035BA7F37